MFRSVVQLSVVLVAAVAAIHLMAADASAQSCGYGGYGARSYAGYGARSYGGYGVYGYRGTSGISVSVNRGYGGYYGGYAYRPAYRTSYRRPVYHDTSHYDYYPGRYIRHHDHYDYVPGHYGLHRTGHWHH